jgi:hypothetical protein
MSKFISKAGLTILLGLLLGGVGGCSEKGGETASPVRTPPMSQGGMADDEAFYGVTVEVSYAGPRELLTDSAMVYVFLRPPGKRMPLAVEQFSGRELPRAVSFAGARDEPVELVARLSPSGRVDRSAEDVEVVQQLSGLRHPPQTLSLILGAPAAPAVPSVSGSTVAVTAPAEVAKGVTGVKTSIRIADGHPFAMDAVVFVIARRPGQVMPSAVRRLSVADLPVEIELSDADSMTFSNRLSDAPLLELFARVSVSGTTSRSSEDWESETVRFDAMRPESVDLSIGRP